MITKRRLLAVLTCLLLIGVTGATQQRDPAVNGRSGGKAIYGDVHITGEALKSSKIVKFDLILYAESRTIVARENLSGEGRYRFNNIPAGLYNISIEVEGQEIANIRVDVRNPLVDDFRQDLAFEWNDSSISRPKPGTVSEADAYQRSPANVALLTKANKATEDKKYDEAVGLLRKIVENDAKDFPVWTELANLHLLQEKYSEAENEYFHAIDLHSDFFPALLNLGRTEIAQKSYDVAIDVLARAIKVRPESAEANYLLGESYLQAKKGSAAVGFLNEALRLDPKGMAEVHLRLALLYNAAGLKDKAAAEYEAFLKKRPDYPDRKKLEDYITANKKP